MALLYKTGEVETIRNRAQLYGLPVRILPADQWPEKHRDVPAFFRNSTKTIYIKDGANDAPLQEYVDHEATHSMRAFKFKPYMYFLEQSFNSIAFSSENGRKLFGTVAESLGIDPFDITLDEYGHSPDLNRICDEINAIIAAHAISGRDAEVIDQIRTAIMDYDEYKAELLNILEQFQNRDNVTKERFFAENEKAFSTDRSRSEEDF